MRVTPQLILAGYCQGIFPMSDPDGDRIAFYSADPRGIIPLDGFHVPRRLAKTIRRRRFEIRFDHDVSAVIEGCAAPAPGREETWISPAMIDIYARLAELGFVHSVEAWYEGHLAGGLYGVAIKGLFAGESMFSILSDASKVALVALVERLRARGFLLLDSQFLTGGHLRQFGAVEISAAEYKARLAEALAVDATF